MAQSIPSAIPESITSLTKGGYPSNTVCSKWGAKACITRKISALLLPGVATIKGYPLLDRCQQQEVVYKPPIQLPSAKQTTVRVVRSWAWKLSLNTCSKRTATSNSSAIERGQKVGWPVEPEDTATRSEFLRLPPRQRSAKG